MAENKSRLKSNTHKWPVLLLAIFLCLVIILSSSTFWLEIKYKNKFYPGLKLAGVNLGGLTYFQAQKIFQAKIEEFNRKGQDFFYQNQKITLMPMVIATTDPDLSYEIIGFNYQNHLKEIFALGRGKNFLDKFWQKIKLVFLPRNYALDLRLNKSAIKKILSDNFKIYEKSINNPAIEFHNNQPVFIKEQIGLSFNYDQVIQRLNTNLTKLDFGAIELKLILTQPKFKISDTEFLWRDIEKISQLSSITLQATSTDNQSTQKTWLVENKEIKKWLNFDWDNKTQKPILIFKNQAILETLKNINTGLEKPMQEAKFILNNNRVEQFQASKTGQTIDLEATTQNLINKIINQKQTVAEIIVKTQEPLVTTANINQLGVKELLGTGESNYLNSPLNRIHNIKTGANSLNGILIKPGEEFSLNTALGEITAEKGYLPELVIKGNKTTPEYGGGLCQIATTMFRLALNTGLKITERQPHAYRVSYYEPAGSDATIYAPHPDLRFINDTPNYLLLQTQADEHTSSLHFEFWGTSDGRQTTTTLPKIFNIVPPGETRYIETTDLAPQKIKCTEIAHNGADAELKRIITWPNGKRQEDVFQSHYRPWQAVCLVGVDPNQKTTTTESLIKP